MVSPLLRDSVWFFIYNLGCGRAVLLVFRLFSERVAFYVDVVLMSSWGEVNPGSSYSAILILPLGYF